MKHTLTKLEKSRKNSEWRESQEKTELVNIQYITKREFRFFQLETPVTLKDYKKAIKSRILREIRCLEYIESKFQKDRYPQEVQKWINEVIKNIKLLEKELDIINFQTEEAGISFQSPLDPRLKNKYLQLNFAYAGI